MVLLGLRRREVERLGNKAKIRIMWTDFHVLQGIVRRVDARYWLERGV